MSGSDSLSEMNTKRIIVAFTPLAGALGFPIAVPLVIRSFGLPSALLLAVILATVWFAFMLRTAEMPGEH